MLTKQTVSVATDLASVLSEKDVALNVVDGSPLMDLTNQSVSQETRAAATRGDFGAFSPEGLIADSRTPNILTNVVDHDETMTEVSELIGARLTSIMDTTRNSVIPDIHSVAERFQEVLGDIVIAHNTPFSILPDVYSDVWASAQLQGLVSRYERSPLAEMTSRYALPKLTHGQLLEMLPVGIDDFDKLVLALVEDMPDNKLVNAYERVFVNRTTLIGRAPGQNRYTADGMMDRNDILFTYLIASNFEEHMPDGIIVSLEDLRLNFARIKTQAGRAIAGVLENRERDLRTKLMVASIDSEYVNSSDVPRKRILVNNDVYLQFLKDSGTPETLFGCVVLGSTPMYDDLLKNKDRYEEAYRKHSGMHRTKVSGDLFRAQTEALSIAMVEYVNAIEDDELGDIPRADIHRSCKEIISGFQPRHFKDEILVIQKVLCDAIYHGTGADMMLEAMATAELDNPKMNPRELALFATIDLTARWLASQIRTKDA